MGRGEVPAAMEADERTAPPGQIRQGAAHWPPELRILGGGLGDEDGERRKKMELGLDP